jgi:hypothetical protein
LFYRKIRNEIKPEDETMKIRTLTTAAAVLLISGTALGSEVEVKGLKSRQKAVGYSLVATLAPAAAGTALFLSSSSGGAKAAGLGLIGLGVALGPSAGRVYADGGFSASRSFRRLVGFGLTVLGAAGATNNQNDMIEAHTSNWKQAGSLAVVGLGLSIISVGAIQDIVAGVRATENFNRAQPKVSWNVGAKYFSKHEAIGASLTVKF